MERRKPMLVRVKDAETGRMMVVREDSMKPHRYKLSEGLTGDLLTRGHKVYDQMQQFDHRPRQQWIDEFQHETNPEWMLWGYERDLLALDELWQMPEFSKLLKRDVWRALLMHGLNTVDIPSQIRGVTDRHVELMREVLDRVCEQHHARHPCPWIDHPDNA